MGQGGKFMLTGGQDGPDLSDFLQPFAVQQRFMRISLCNYALNSLKQCSQHGGRSAAERLMYAGLVTQAVNLAFDLSKSDGSSLASENLREFEEIFRIALALAVLALDRFEELLSYPERMEEAQFVRELVALLTTVIRSEAIPLRAREVMIDPLQELEQTANRNCADILNPARHEFQWVHEDALRLGGALNQIALEISSSLDGIYGELRLEQWRKSS